MIPVDVSTSPPVVIRTTAGLTAAATSMVAELSVIGRLLAPTVVPVGPARTGAGRSSPPVARRASTVPVEASTAERRDAARSVARPPRPDLPESLAVGRTAVVGTVPGTTAGSYQRSGVVAVSRSPSCRDQSFRGSDGGEYRSTAAEAESPTGGAGVAGHAGG